VAGDYVAVRVADTGSGIPHDVRDRIFEPFFTTKEVGKGSGLGLPQVLGLVKQLGGGLSIRSAPDEGTCASIFLPPLGP
jgi:signal transduction histidine kinase